MEWLKVWALSSNLSTAETKQNKNSKGLFAYNPSTKQAEAGGWRV
jgi:hypothetical protein